MAVKPLQTEQLGVPGLDEEGSSGARGEGISAFRVQRRQENERTSKMGE